MLIHVQWMRMMMVHEYPYKWTTTEQVYMLPIDVLLMSLSLFQFLRVSAIFTIKSLEISMHARTHYGAFAFDSSSSSSYHFVYLHFSFRSYLLGHQISGIEINLHYNIVWTGLASILVCTVNMCISWFSASAGSTSSLPSSHFRLKHWNVCEIFACINIWLPPIIIYRLF